MHSSGCCSSRAAHIQPWASQHDTGTDCPLLTPGQCAAGAVCSRLCLLRPMAATRQTPGTCVSWSGAVGRVETC